MDFKQYVSFVVFSDNSPKWKIKTLQEFLLNKETKNETDGQSLF